MKLYYYGVRFFKYTEGTDSNELSAKVYSYHSTVPCRVGDLVVAETRDGYKIVKVDNEGHEHALKASAFIVCNVTNHVAAVNAARNRMFRMNALKAAMESKLTESKFLEMCKQMSAQDPELARLLDEYHALTSDVTDE
jgi:hypothetical protein